MNRALLPAIVAGVLASVLASCEAPAGAAAPDVGAAPAPAGAPARGADVQLLGAGEHLYLWDGDFPPPPAGGWGNTHGEIVFDASGNAVISFDLAPAIRVFAPDGRLLAAWGEEFAGGVHGMTIARDVSEARDEHGQPLAGAAPGDEHLFFVHFGRHEVVKATLDGRIVWRRGAPLESRKYAAPEEFNPTSIAVAPDGTVFVADGYGKQWIHRYLPDGTWKTCFGGPGRAVGQLDCAHGIAVDARGSAEASSYTLLVADRENGRIQRFGPFGSVLGVVAQAPDLRRPCKIAFSGEHFVVPDLAGRVSIFDGTNRLVTHLGDQPDESLRANNGVPPERWRAHEFLAPHSAAWDAHGNLLVMDWNARGRITRLCRAAAPSTATR